MKTGFTLEKVRGHLAKVRGLQGPQRSIVEGHLELNSIELYFITNILLRNSKESAFTVSHSEKFAASQIKLFCHHKWSLKRLQKPSPYSFLVGGWTCLAGHEHKGAAAVL